MKKTLIVLMALSGIAMGETAPKTKADAAYSITNATTSNSTLDISSDTKAYTAMTLTFKLKADAFLTELYSCGQNHTNATLASVATTTNNSTTNLGMAIRYNSSSNTKSSIYAVYSSNSAASGLNGMSNGFGPTSWTATLNGSTFSSTSAFTDLLDRWGYNSLTQKNKAFRLHCSLE